MREDVRERALRLAEHILETGDTVRACAARFGVSKTTIHKDLRERLPRLDAELSARVGEVLRRNLSQRHLRGGEATRRKFREAREGASHPT